jgi:putative glutamine amidotransferase
MRDGRPIIGITSASPDILPAGSTLYIDAVERAGGKAVFVCPGDPKALAAQYCGFIIPGGKDLDPSCYGEERIFPLVPEDSARSDFEMSLLREIIGLGKPILGICYGMQLINVFLGGSLYQDICSQKADSLNHREGMHPIVISDNPYIGAGAAVVNSSHHQAVKTTGRGITPFAFAPDGIAEACFLKAYGFLVGVQWHPERMETAVTSSIFERFVEACRARQ